MSDNKNTVNSSLPKAGLRTLVYGHRGAMAYAPQNTMASFSLAWEMGVHGIELDAQCSREGVPVVYHDDTLDSLTSGHGPVREHDLEDLLRLDAGSHFSPKFSAERIPLLETVLRVRPEGTFINIELKTDLIYDPLWRQFARVLTGYQSFAPSGDSARDKESVRVASATAACIRKVSVDVPDLPKFLMVSSFDPLALKTFGAAYPGIPLAFLYYHAIHFDTRVMMKKIEYQAWHPNEYEVNALAVKREHEQGKLVNVWTVNRTLIAKRLIAMKVDGVITNYPDIMLKLIES